MCSIMVLVSNFHVKSCNSSLKETPYGYQNASEGAINHSVRKHLSIFNLDGYIHLVVFLTTDSINIAGHWHNTVKESLNTTLI